MSKTDTQNHELDDSSSKINKLEAKLADLTIERDEMARQRKERESKIQDLNRKYKLEKESAQALRQVYQPKLKETIGFQRDLAG